MAYTRKNNLVVLNLPQQILFQILAPAKPASPIAQQKTVTISST